MSINPYILTFLSDYHGLQTPADLASHLASFHLHIGHLTGFGKLIDEKIIAKDEFPDFATEDGYKPAQTHFIDNLVYDGKQPNAYIDQFEIGLKQGDKL